MRMRPEELPDLLKRYLNGTCSAQEKQIIDFWYNHFDPKQDSEEVTAGKPQMQEMIWNQIQEKITGSERPNSITSKNIHWWRNKYIQLAVAASFLLFGGLYYYEVVNKSSSFLPPGLTQYNNLHDEENTGTGVKTVHLEDGSQVTLQPGSSIHFVKPFEKLKREVHLDGEAFFKVTKDASKPFVVYTGDIATKVVGTSFIIRSGHKNSQDVEVSVITGKVIVEKNETRESAAVNNGVVLTPNQKVTYYHDDSHFVTGLVDKPVTVQAPQELSKTKLFKFEGEPLRQVLEKLEYAYGLKFELINDGISNCPVTADLTSQPLYTKLDIISASLNAHYQIKGTSIVLSGGSCD